LFIIGVERSLYEAMFDRKRVKQEKSGLASAGIPRNKIEKL